MEGGREGVREGGREGGRIKKMSVINPTPTPIATVQTSYGYSLHQ